VSFAFAGQEPVAEEPASPLHEMTLSEIGRAIDQHGPNQVGMGKQNCIGAAQPEPCDIALLSSNAQEKPGSIPMERYPVTEKRPTSRRCAHPSDVARGGAGS
jgi:hypothetical protein